VSDCQVQQNVSIADLGDENREWLRPFLMGQRRALLMQVDSIEKTLGIEPTTADLRRKQKSDIMAAEG